MSVLLKKILWYKVSERYATAYNITDCVNFDNGAGLDIKNNTLVINLKNSYSTYVTIGSNTYMASKYIQTALAGLKFEQNDLIKLYLKYTDDPQDIISASWISSSTSVDESSLVGLYYITEYSIDNNANSSKIKLVCADRTLLLFDRILAKTFTIDNNLKTNELVQKVVQLASESSRSFDPMSFIIGGARYDIESSTYIQSVRGDATQFPTKSLSKTFKPIYEWLRDLSQIEYLNTDAELAGTLLYGRPFMFWVDENNYFHWVEQSDTTGGSLTVGVDKIYSSKLNKSTFDAMNMIIFNAGTDMNGHGILDFYLDDDSKIKGNKMQFVPMLSIAKSNIDDDYKINTSRNDGRFPQYVTAGSYPLTNTAWGATGIANDSEYNTTLRAKCKADGQKRARSIVSKTSGARWKGSVQMKGQIYTPGTLLLFTDIRAGLYNQKLRVMEVKHSIEKSGWITQLDLEEDTKTIVSLS